MSALGLWGLPAEFGSLARESDAVVVDRPESAWAPRLGLRGSLIEYGSAAREVRPARTGSYSELLSFTETNAVISAFALDSFSMMLLVSETSTPGVQVVDRPYAEVLGLVESYTGQKASRGSYFELLSISDTLIGQPGATPPATYGSYGDAMTLLDSYQGRKDGRGSYSELLSFADSIAAGVPGTGTDPGPIGKTTRWIVPARQKTWIVSEQ